MRLRRLCPVCGSKMKVSKDGAGGCYLRCTYCPLDYGWGWYISADELIEEWEDAPNQKKTLGRTKPKAVVKINEEGKVLERYKSINEAAKKNPMSKTSIENRTRKKLKNEFAVCDYTFRLEDDIYQGRK